LVVSVVKVTIFMAWHADCTMLHEQKRQKIMLHTKFNTAPTWASLVDNFISTSANHDSLWEGQGKRPKANVVELTTGYEIALAVPGIQKSDIQIKLDKHILTISYKPSDKADKVEGSEKYLLNEFSMDEFERRFTLGASIDKDNISAKQVNGILTLTLLKKEHELAPSKTVSID
jgi:HSP20 family protein